MSLLSDSRTTVTELKGLVAEFVAERDWQPFHDPKNLSTSIAIEAAELMEHFQWLRSDQLERAVSDPAALEKIREEVADILRPGLALNGITQIRRIAAVAETYYVAVAPYHDGGSIGTAAALHLAASLPNFFIQQIPLPEAEADRRMRAEIAGPSVEVVKDGYAALPTAAGLGITVNQEALEKYKERA